MVLCIMPNDKGWVKGVGLFNGVVLNERGSPKTVRGENLMGDQN